MLLVARGAMLVPRPRTQGAPIVTTTGATEDPASGRRGVACDADLKAQAALLAGPPSKRPGGSAIFRQTLLGSIAGEVHRGSPGG